MTATTDAEKNPLTRGDFNGDGEVSVQDAILLLRYISHHTESAINVRSLAVLRELYA